MANERSPWPTITFLGVLCGVALGAIAILLWRSRRDQLALGPGTPQSLDGLDLDSLSWNAPPKVRVKPLAKRALAEPRVRPVARTLMISDAEPTAILKAVGETDWNVFVRVIGPVGSSAQFMLSSSTSDSITLESGDFQDMKIPRGEFLYAQGSISGVMVTASGGPK